jgi:outer membrane biosynthesis protein TonB
VAVLTGLAGLVAAIVVTYLIAAPPDVSSDIQGAIGGGQSTETIARGGAVIGLAAALAIAALSGLTLLASPAALEPLRRPRPAPAPKPATQGPRLASTQVQALPVPERKAATPAPRPKPARKRTAPEPAASREPATKPPAKRTPASKPAKPRSKAATPKPAAAKPKRSSRPSLATATAPQLTRIGFTKAQAERIVRYREEGRVTKLADLKRVPGIARPVLAELVKRFED